MNVAISHLSHRYEKSRRVLEDISLEVNAGELFGFLGPNGSGKTTLFRILSTLIRPAEGQALLGGFDIALASTSVRKILGVVFQYPTLDKKLSVFENLKFHGYLYGLRGAALFQAIEENLQRLHLEDLRNRRVSDLSGGLRRRVELAKVLLTEPKVLILDEPTTGLDPKARAEFWELLNSFRKTKKATVLITTHFLDEAENCDRIALLDSGRLVASGSPPSLKESIGKDILTIKTHQAELLLASLKQELNLNLALFNGGLKGYVASSEEAGLSQTLLSKFSDQIEGIAIHKPNLEDVFYEFTGHEFSTHL